MDDGSLSILKLLEEDEVESMHSAEEVDAFQTALNRDIQENAIVSEGSNDLPSQQFATGNNGIRDANTNLNSLENTKMKEPQRSSLVSQEQGSKLSSQQAHKVEQPVHPMNHGPSVVQIREYVGIVSGQLDENGKRQLGILYDKFKKNEIVREVFLNQMKNVAGDPTIDVAMKLYNLRQETMGIKAPVCPSNSRVSSTTAEIKDQKSDPRGVLVNQQSSTSSGTSSGRASSQGLNKHPQQHNQGSTGVGRLAKSTINMMTDPKSERPTSVNGPSKVQGGPVSHFQPLYSPPQQGSVTKGQTVGPLSSVVHVKPEPAQKPRSFVQQTQSNVPVKQNNGIPRRSNDALEHQSSKMVFPPSTTNANFVSPSMTTQLDFSTMVNLPGPSGTIPAEASVMTTTKMLSFGRKKPLETQGSSLPPSSKKQKVCPNSSQQSIEQLNDITAGSGVNLEEEEHLLFSRRNKDGHVSEASRMIVRQEEERTILQKIPLQRKLAEIMAKSGLKKMSNDVERCLSLCVEERMRGLLSNMIRVSKQRTDVEKSRNRTCITSDIRKQINEMNQKMKEELERKQAEDKELKNAEIDTGDIRSKANKEEEDKMKAVAVAREQKEKMIAKAANVAAHAAIGGNDPFLKWKVMAEERQKKSPGPGTQPKKPSAETGGRRLGKKQGSPKVVRSISVKDVINVVEKEPQMSRSTLLYRLYNRISSNVQNQE